MKRRRGAALLLVLSVITGMAALAALANESARHGLAAVTNRMALTRAYWLAEGCAAEELARLETWLAGAPITRWSWLDSTAASDDSCVIVLRPRGLRLDVNRASGHQIAALLTASGAPAADAISFAAAILDWRDADDFADSGSSSEREWYLREGRVPPRNGPLASPEELALVRGTEELPGVEYLGVDDGLVVLSRAPAPVLAGLPGMMQEAVQAVLAARAESPFPDVTTIAARLGDAARERLYRELHALRQQAVTVPESWVLTLRAASDSASAVLTLELVLARDGARIAVVRRRTWP